MIIDEEEYHAQTLLSNRTKMARQRMKIDGRYDKQDVGRREYTPKQQRRMRKQVNKWRKRILGK